MLLILVGKRVLRWWGLRWWVRYAYPPCTGSGGGFMVGAQAYPPYREVVMGSWWVRFAYPPYKTLGSP